MKANYSILNHTDRYILEEYIDIMNTFAPDIMRRKNPVAVYQQAWCLMQAVEAIKELIQTRSRIHVVIVGVLDDPIYPTLQKLYAPGILDIIVCDPVVNQKTSHTLVEEGIVADIVIACSVWEHDVSAYGFLKDLVDLSRDTIILTADFHPSYFGKSIPSTSFRILNEETLISCLNQCNVEVESSDLETADEDLFCWEGCWYYFLKMVIKT